MNPILSDCSNDQPASREWIDLSRLESYDYNLPEGQIAQSPVFPRDESRLLVVDRETGTLQHSYFYELHRFLDPTDILVANNTQVFRARLQGSRVLRDREGNKQIGGQVECFLLEKWGERTWEVLMKSSRKAVEGFQFEIPVGPDGDCIQGEVVSTPEQAFTAQLGTKFVRFNRDPVQENIGSVPLPHYIRRDLATASISDQDSYQTVYAKEEGSCAAPTAGLHFTPRVFDRLKSKGIDWAEVTLHVGIGTFRPVKTSEISDHQMHSERFEIDEETSKRLWEAKSQGRKICSVGTTTVRALESAWDPEGKAPPRTGPQRTSIFIHPTNEKPRPSFHAVDRLITNFHLPKSTLLMLVSAFAGKSLIEKAYHEALVKKYRFLSYGDAMLIL